MTDPGLNQRLRQRSRRSGLMIGISMALTLMVCVAAFTMIYARLEPVVGDFVGRGEIDVPTPIPTQEPVAQDAAPAPTTAPAETNVTEPAASGGDNQANPTPTSAIEEDDAAFTPDYQIDAGGPVNLRPGPGVASGDAVIALPVGTPLMYMDEERATTDPQRDDLGEGDVWMRFTTEDGQDGWIREVDVSEYVP